jgi:hypothetical protein
MRATYVLPMIAFLSFSVLVVDSHVAGAVGGPALGCATHLGSFGRSGSTISASGSQTCNGVTSGFNPRDLTVKISRSRALGLWQVMSSSWSGWNIPAFNSTVDSVYNCGGTGTHTFRGEAQGTMLGTFSVWERSEVRWSC